MAGQNILPRRSGGKYESAAVRDRLLMSAIDIFTQRGYAAATVREIVEAAGVTKPVLYYYFGSKEGIYLEIMKEALEVFRECLTSPGHPGTSAGDDILNLCGNAYDLAHENLKVVRLIHTIFYGPREGAPPCVPPTAFHDLFYEAILRLIRRGVHSGEFVRRHEEAMVYAILGAFGIAIELEMATPDQFMGKKGLKRILDVILTGMTSTKR